MDKELSANIKLQFWDDYKHFSSSIEYIPESILCESDLGNKDEFSQLTENYNTLLLNSCNKCDNENMCALCHHGPNYTLDPDSGELVLNPNKKEYMIYECTSMCSCTPNKCRNRLVQYGPRDNLEVKYSRLIKSLGLFTTKDIPANAFICEYAGELLTPTIARHRILRNYEHKNMNYILCLQESPIESMTGNQSKQPPKYMTFIDPTRKGNIGRYLNHSCNPNCSIYTVRVESPIPKIGIFSNRFIPKNEELCFHYNEGVPRNYLRRSKDYVTCRECIPCLCGSDNCERYLPNYNFLIDVVNGDN